MQRTAPVAHQTKHRYVYAAPRDRIVQCVPAPGQRLIIEQIAAQPGASPIPVCEALRLVQNEKFAAITPHLGAVVTPISAVAITSFAR